MKPTPCVTATATTTVTSVNRARVDGDALVEWAESEIDNIRAAHTWSVDKAEFETALGFVSSLQQLWVNRSRFLEGIASFDAIFTDGRYRDSDVATRIWVRALGG